MTPAAITAPSVTYDGPLTITRGGTYKGAWSDVTIATTEPVVIDNSAVKGVNGYVIGSKVGTAIDVEVRNSTLGAGPMPAGKDLRAFKIDGGFKRLVVENCDMVATSGMWLHSANPAEVKIRRNRFRNITKAAGWFVQAIQFDKVHGGDVEIAFNEAVNEAGLSACEDVFNFFASGGTPTNVWQVHDNLIWGAFPNPASSTSYSGGGIMHGDSDGGYIETHHNVVLGTTNYGLSIVGGVGFNVHDNRVISSGTLADGTKLPSSANGGPVGLAMWSNNASKIPPKDCRMVDNVVGWWKPLANAGKGARNDAWTPNAGTNGNIVTGTVYLPAGPIGYAAEQAEYDAWRARTAGMVIGRATATTPPPVVVPPVVTPPAPTGPTQAQYDALQGKYDALARDLLIAQSTVANLTDRLAASEAARTEALNAAYRVGVQLNAAQAALDRAQADLNESTSAADARLAALIAAVDAAVAPFR